MRGSAAAVQSRARNETLQQPAVELYADLQKTREPTKYYRHQNLQLGTADTEL